MAMKTEPCGLIYGEMEPSFIRDERREQQQHHQQFLDLLQNKPTWQHLTQRAQGMEATLRNIETAVQFEYAPSGVRFTTCEYRTSKPFPNVSAAARFILRAHGHDHWWEAVKIKPSAQVGQVHERARALGRPQGEDQNRAPALAQAQAPGHTPGEPSRSVMIKSLKPEVTPQTERDVPLAVTGKARKSLAMQAALKERPGKKRKAKLDRLGPAKKPKKSGIEAILCLLRMPQYKLSWQTEALRDIGAFVRFYTCGCGQLRYIWHHHREIVWSFPTRQAAVDHIYNRFGHAWMHNVVLNEEGWKRFDIAPVKTSLREELELSTLRAIHTPSFNDEEIASVAAFAICGSESTEQRLMKAEVLWDIMKFVQFEMCSCKNFMYYQTNPMTGLSQRFTGNAFLAAGLQILENYGQDWARFVNLNSQGRVRFPQSAPSLRKPRNLANDDKPWQSPVTSPSALPITTDALHLASIALRVVFTEDSGLYSYESSAATTYHFQSLASAHEHVFAAFGDSWAAQELMFQPDPDLYAGVNLQQAEIDQILEDIGQFTDFVLFRHLPQPGYFVIKEDGSEWPIRGLANRKETCKDLFNRLGKNWQRKVRLNEAGRAFFMIDVIDTSGPLDSKPAIHANAGATAPTLTSRATIPRTEEQQHLKRIGRFAEIYSPPGSDQWFYPIQTIYAKHYIWSKPYPTLEAAKADIYRNYGHLWFQTVRHNKLGQDEHRVRHPPLLKPPKRFKVDDVHGLSLIRDLVLIENHGREDLPLWQYTRVELDGSLHKDNAFFTLHAACEEVAGLWKKDWRKRVVLRKLSREGTGADYEEVDQDPSIFVDGTSDMVPIKIEKA